MMSLIAKKGNSVAVVSRALPQQAQTLDVEELENRWAEEGLENGDAGVETVILFLHKTLALERWRGTTRVWFDLPA